MHLPAVNGFRCRCASIAGLAAVAVAVAVPSPAPARAGDVVEPGASHDLLAPGDLAEHAGRPDTLVDGAFVVERGDVVELVLDAPAPFRAVGFWWEGTLGREHPLPTAWSTVLAVDGGLDPAYPVVPAHDLAPEVAGATGPAGDATLSGLLHVQDEPGIAVRLVLSGPVRLEGLAVVWVDPDPSIKAPRVTTPNDGFGAPASYPKPPVYSRGSWGADPPQCNSGYCTVTHVAMHHTAGASEYDTTSWQQSANNVKSIQAYHMYTRGWCDIGYNYLIDRFGYIFEGRAGGDDVRGAHDGYNCGSMGVAMMGYFHTPYNQTLTTSMKDSFAELGAWKCDQKNIDPLGTDYYAGYGGYVKTIYGHRDVSSTACPGDLAYQQLPTIRNDIADRLAGGGGGGEIIMDNGSASFTKDWSTGTSANDKYGSNYRFRSTNLARGLGYWRPNISEAGVYTVYFWWPDGSNRNSSATVGVRINNDTTTTTVNQQINGGRWNSIGAFWFPRGTGSLVGVASDGPGSNVTMCDAVRLVRN